MGGHQSSLEITYVSHFRVLRGLAVEKRRAPFLPVFTIVTKIVV